MLRMLYTPVNRNWNPHTCDVHWFSLYTIATAPANCRICWSLLLGTFSSNIVIISLWIWISVKKPVLCPVLPSTYMCTPFYFLTVSHIRIYFKRYEHKTNDHLHGVKREVLLAVLALWWSLWALWCHVSLQVSFVEILTTSKSTEELLVGAHFPMNLYV